MEEGEESGEHLLQLAYRNPWCHGHYPGSKPFPLDRSDNTPDYTLF